MSFTDNNLYQILFEENRNVLLLMDKFTGNIVHANKAACVYYQYTYEQLTSLNITDINPLSEKEIIQEIEKASIEKRNYYFTHRLGNNEYRKVEVNSTPVKVNNKDYLFLIVSDVAEKNSRQLMITGLFYESPNAMAILDEKKQILTVNKSFTKMFGYELAEVKSKSLDEFIIPDDLHDEIPGLLEHIMNGKVINRNSFRKTKDNKLIEVNIIVTPYQIGNEIMGSLIVYTDITEQQKIIREMNLIKEEADNLIKESYNQLQLILDSTLEAIFGIDNDGKCTFCNASGLKMLGYTNQSELIGQTIHNLIHHTYKDGRPMPLEECKIYRSLRSGIGVHVDDEVFWRRDNTSFAVNYYSYPQISDGKIIGAVITFTDITERKKYDEHIEYLSSHDSLTGLYNRQYFEEAIKRYDKDDNLPITIIFGDVNGFKLSNDIYGHKAGDNLLKKAAEILKASCDKEAIIARVGGDEFALILTNTTKDAAKQIVENIRNRFSKEHFKAIKGSISIGYETKTNNSDDLDKILENAETMMYKEKVINRKITKTGMIQEIIDTLHKRSDKERVHSIRVRDIAKAIAEEMGLSETEIRKVKDAAYLHDIGKIALDDESLLIDELVTEDTKEKIKQHTVIGFRILNLFDKTMDLAESVLNHHEYWDGTGYPNGLKGEEIPLNSRIISIAEGYYSLINEYNSNRIEKHEAIRIIKEQSGKKYDPNIVNIFLRIMDKA